MAGIGCGSVGGAPASITTNFWCGRMGRHKKGVRSANQTPSATPIFFCFCFFVFCFCFDKCLLVTANRKLREHSISMRPASASFALFWDGGFFFVLRSTIQVFWTGDWPQPALSYCFQTPRSILFSAKVATKRTAERERRMLHFCKGKKNISKIFSL